MREENTESVPDIQMEDVIKEVGQKLTFTSNFRKRVLTWLKNHKDGQYAAYNSRITLQYLVEVAKKDSSCGTIMKYRGMGNKKISLILQSALLYLEKHNLGDGETYRSLKNAIAHFRSAIDPERALEEVASFSELEKLANKLTHSNFRDEYFAKLFSFAKTRDELFLIVKRGYKCPVWPKAVRALAALPDLKEFSD